MKIEKIHLLKNFLEIVNFSKLSNSQKVFKKIIKNPKMQLFITFLFQVFCTNNSINEQHGNGDDCNTNTDHNDIGNSCNVDSSFSICEDDEIISYDTGCNDSSKGTCQEETLEVEENKLGTDHCTKNDDENSLITESNNSADTLLEEMEVEEEDLSNGQNESIKLSNENMNTEGSIALINDKPINCDSPNISLNDSNSSSTVSSSSTEENLTIEHETNLNLPKQCGSKDSSSSLPSKKLLLNDIQRIEDKSGNEAEIMSENDYDNTDSKTSNDDIYENDQYVSSPSNSMITEDNSDSKEDSSHSDKVNQFPKTSSNNLFRMNNSFNTKEKHQNRNLSSDFAIQNNDSTDSNADDQSISESSNIFDKEDSSESKKYERSHTDSTKIFTSKKDGSESRDTNHSHDVSSTTITNQKDASELTQDDQCFTDTMIQQEEKHPIQPTWKNISNANVTNSVIELKLRRYNNAIHNISYFNPKNTPLLLINNVDTAKSKFLMIFDNKNYISNFLSEKGNNINFEINKKTQNLTIPNLLKYKNKKLELIKMTIEVIFEFLKKEINFYDENIQKELFNLIKQQFLKTKKYKKSVDDFIKLNLEMFKDDFDECLELSDIDNLIVDNVKITFRLILLFLELCHPDEYFLIEEYFFRNRCLSNYNITNEDNMNCERFKRNNEINPSNINNDNFENNANNDNEKANENENGQANKNDIKHANKNDNFEYNANNDNGKGNEKNFKMDLMKSENAKIIRCNHFAKENIIKEIAENLKTTNFQETNVIIFFDACFTIYYWLNDYKMRCYYFKKLIKNGLTKRIKEAFFSKKLTDKENEENLRICKENIEKVKLFTCHHICTKDFRLMTDSTIKEIGGYFENISVADVKLYGFFVCSVYFGLIDEVVYEITGEKCGVNLYELFGYEEFDEMKRCFF